MTWRVMMTMTMTRILKMMMTKTAVSRTVMMLKMTTVVDVFFVDRMSTYHLVLLLMGLAQDSHRHKKTSIAVPDDDVRSGTLSTWKVHAA